MKRLLTAPARLGYDFAPARRPHRLVAQDIGLSRRKRGFDSPWGRQFLEYFFGFSWVVNPKIGVLLALVQQTGTARRLSCGDECPRIWYVGANSTTSVAPFLAILPADSVAEN